MRIFKTLGVAAAMSAGLGAGAAVADEIRVGNRLFSAFK